MLVEKDLQIAELRREPQNHGNAFDQAELMEQIDRLKIENSHLRRNYEREKELVNQKVRELEEFQANFYDRQHQEKQDLLESKSTNMHLEQQLVEAKNESKHLKSTIDGLKSQIKSQVKMFSQKFKDIEKAYQSHLQMSQTQDLTLSKLEARIKDMYV